MSLYNMIFGTNPLSGALLDEYRLHFYTGTPLTKQATEGNGGRYE